MHYATPFLAIARTAQLVLAATIPSIDLANPRLDNLYMMTVAGSDDEPEPVQQGTVWIQRGTE